MTKDGAADTKTYSYDSRGNRSQMTENGAVTSYAYDLNNRLISQTTGNREINYTYDNNGNMLSKTVGASRNWTQRQPNLGLSLVGSGNGEASEDADTVLYSYDVYNQLTGIQSNNGMNASYEYNVLGKRISKTVNGNRIKYLWYGENLAYDGNGTSYFFGSGIVGSKDNGVYEFYLKDGHGSITYKTDSAGNINSSYTYDAFGNETEDNATDGNPFRYCGEYYDTESGLIYLRNRYYDPSVGRFISEDPYWNPDNMIYGDNASNSNVPDYSAIRQSANLYVYCMSNPVMFVDPLGMLVSAEDMWNLDFFQLNRLKYYDSLYQQASNNADLIGMNKSHYNATQIRRTYNASLQDDYDYTHGGKVATFYYNAGGVSGNVYIVRGDDSVWTERQTCGINDYIIVDYTDRGGYYTDNPRMQIINSYRADNKEIRYEIIDILLSYETNHPSDWSRRDRDSLEREWWLHNLVYITDDLPLSQNAKHVDLDNNGGK